jgi:hypothetical protein
VSDEETSRSADNTATETVASQPRKQRRKRKPVLPPDQWEAVLNIAEQLQERQHNLIVEIVRHMGADFAQTLMQETLSIEAQGGMLVLNGERRRTPGGVFFFLAKQKMPPEVVQQVFPFMTWKERRERAKQWKQKRQANQQSRQQRPPRPPEPALPPFVWEKRHEVIADLLQQPGTASTAKVMLIGRPEMYELFTDLAYITLTHPPRLNSLPRGVPRPESGLEATYSVLIGLKQWRKVEPALLADETDILVIEGLYAFSQQLGGMAVYATNATTRNLQIQQRQAKNT